MDLIELNDEADDFAPLGTARSRDELHPAAVELLQLVIVSPHGWRPPDGDLVALLASGDLARFDLIAAEPHGDPWRFYASAFAQQLVDRLTRDRAPATPSRAIRELSEAIAGRRPVAGPRSSATSSRARNAKGVETSPRSRGVSAPHTSLFQGHDDASAAPRPHDRPPAASVALQAQPAVTSQPRELAVDSVEDAHASGVQLGLDVASHFDAAGDGCELHELVDPIAGFDDLGW
jgi:hypothetical protein